MSAERRDMARPAAVMAAGTIASRLTGLLRVIAMGVALGIGGSRLADTFNVANTLPNIVNELILGGVLTSVFIPLVVEALRQEDGELAIGALVGTTLAVLVVSSVALAVAAPLVVRIFTFHGGATSAQQTALAAFFFRFFAFQVLFYGMTAVYGGVFCVLDLALYPFLRVEGLAWAHTLGYMLGAGLAGASLSHRVGGLRWRRVAGQAGRVTLAAAGSAVVMWVALRAVGGHAPGLVARAEAVLASGAAGLAVFAGAATLLGVDDYHRLRALAPWGSRGQTPAGPA